MSMLGLFYKFIRAYFYLALLVFLVVSSVLFVSLSAGMMLSLFSSRDMDFSVLSVAITTLLTLTFFLPICIILVFFLINVINGKK